MEQYKRHRKVLRTAFSKIGNELEQLLTAERTDLQDIQVHWDLLEDKYGSLQDINKNVFDSLLESDAPEEELGAEMESCDGYMKRFKLLKYKYEQLRGTTGSINEERASINYLRNLTFTDCTFWKTTQKINQPQTQNLPIRTEHGQWAKNNTEKNQAYASHLVDVFKPHPSDDNPHLEDEIRQYLEYPNQLD
ncbi:hypothetical protein JTB14_036686 [Gonioctena quinquepunctata]|nr:hypothetical protein JTB14_036686 [Gonioctena quinquepunctata]